MNYSEYTTNLQLPHSSNIVNNEQILEKLPALASMIDSGNYRIDHISWFVKFSLYSLPFSLQAFATFTENLYKVDFSFWGLSRLA